MKTQIPMYIYRATDGLRCRIVSEAEFKKASKTPGVRVTEWQGRELFPFDFVIAHHAWMEPDDVRYLAETQISMWPAFQNGLALEWAQGGIGGSEQRKTAEQTA